MSKLNRNPSIQRQRALAPSRRRRRVPIGLLMAMTMVAAACGSDEESSDTTAAAVATTAAPPATTAAAAETTEAAAETTEAAADTTEAAADTTAAAPTTEAATTTAADAEADLDALVAAAQEEGVLNWYGALSEAQNALVSQAFEEKYGIKVTMTRLNSTDLWQRFTAELDAGAPTADLIMTANTGVLDGGLADGLIVPVSADNIPGYPVDVQPQFLDELRQTPRVWVAPFGISYNTDSVSEDEVPTEWTDLADPRWANEILFNPPSTADSIADFYRFLADEYGDEFVTQMVANKNRFMDGGVPTQTAVAAGEADLGVPGSVGTVGTLRGEGAPIQIVFPTPSLAGEVVIYPTTDAVHPNAALLFTHFLMSREGNEAFTSDSPIASVTGGAEGAPEMKFLGNDPMTDEERAHIIELVEG